MIGPFATLGQALAAVAVERPDLAVLDINLRGDTVFPLADLLAAQDIPFVFVTGYDAAAMPERFRHVQRYEKPVRIGGLLKSLGHLASGKAFVGEAAITPAG